MSRGIGGLCRLIMQDENTLLYEYAPYNLNEPAYKNSERIYDGLITIERSAFVEPEIHEKLKRMPNGKKKVVIKRIHSPVDYESLLATGKIIVQNSRFCWHTLDNGCGTVALRLIFKIFGEYQDNGIPPEKVSFHL